MSSEATRVTPLDIPSDQVIQFPEGLPGFPELRRFGLFQDAEDSPLFTLQSLEEPAVAFSVADPAVFGFRYDMPVTDADKAALGLKDGDEIAVAVMLFKSDEGSGVSINANLGAPLLFNVSTHVAIQHAIPKLAVDVTLRAA